MATITKRTSPLPGVDPKSVSFARKLGPYQAGEALAPGDSCRVTTAGLAVKASNAVIGGTGSHFAESEFWGMVAETFISGSKGVMLYGAGAQFGYSTGMTLGAKLYLGTGGALQDTMPTAVDRPVARVVNATTIEIIR